MVRSALTRILVAGALCVLVPLSGVLAQGRPGGPPPLPFDVGSAVLLATNSLQVDRNTIVVSGDLVVNNASTGPVYGEKDLSIDQGITIPAGYALKANSVDVDPGAVVNGTIYTNDLQNGGALNGEVISPVALPIIAALPQLPPGVVAGTTNITVANGQTQILGTGQYGSLSIGRDATLRLGGGPYVFTSVSAERGATIVWDGPGEMMILGRLSLGAGATITNGANVVTKHKMIFVYGANGTDGALLSTPPAVSFGRDNTIRATVLAPNGSIVAGEGANVVGALLGRDILIGRDSSLTLSSGFRNLPPVGHDQEVTTNSTSPVTITLTGFDPDGDPLQFSIVRPPSAGTLSPITPSGPASAVVVYTPATAGAPDSIVFRVTDAEGAFGLGIVSINGGLPPPPPPTTVIVDDQSATVPQNVPTILALLAQAPPGVALNVSIVPGSGPSHGTLGPVMQPSLMPPLPARVPYAPQPGFAGTDSFQFQACGVIAGSPVCDTGTFTITVQAPPTDAPELAPDAAVTVAAGVVASITLPTPPPNATASSTATAGRFTLKPSAAFLTSAAVAGNVADSNNDGLGDNHNALPGAAPALMSAGVGQSGGPGANGTARMEFEWDISGFAGLASSMTGASVLLHTNRGTLDSAGTTFYFALDPNDGQLTDDDYQRLNEPKALAVMQVPAGQPVGADGVFSFDVTGPLREALNLGATHLTLQGRVDETQAAPARGLQVYTTASGNLTAHLEPQLGISTGGIFARTYRIVSLPSIGTLRDSNNTLITTVPYVLPSSVLLYNPGGAAGQTSFTYEVTDGPAHDTGVVSITIVGGDCAVDPQFCNGGRD